MLEYFFIATAFFICILGSYTDLKTREVPDWLNFSGIITGVFVHAIGAVLSWNGWFFLEAVFGLGIGFVIGAAMYYGGQWGGGDAKMLMALGALLGFTPQLNTLFFGVLVYTIIVGGFYGLAWSGILALLHRKQFVQTLHDFVGTPQILLLRKGMIVAIILGVITPFFISDPLIQMMTAILLVGTPLLIWLFFCIKAVEYCCMIKAVHPSVVTEGDWIAKDVIVKGKRICGPTDLGITQEQLALLQKLARQKKIKTVIVKYGIPFVPTFLIALIAALALQNPLVWVF